MLLHSGYLISFTDKFIPCLSAYIRTCLLTQFCHLSTSIRLHLSSNKLLPRDLCTPVLPWRHFSAWSCRAGSWIQQWWTTRHWKGVFPVVDRARASLKYQTHITRWHVMIWAPERKSMWGRAVRKSGMTFLLLHCKAERQLIVNVYFIIIWSLVFSFKAVQCKVYYSLGSLNEQSVYHQGYYKRLPK